MGSWLWKRQVETGNRLKIGPFDIVIDEGLLFRDGHRVSIRPQVMQALVHLARHPGKLVTRQELAHVLWSGSYADDGQSLNVVIRSLRRVLGDDPKTPKYIETIPTRGYRFIAGPGEDVKPKKHKWSNRPMIAAVVMGLVSIAVLIIALLPQEVASSHSSINSLPSQVRVAYVKSLKLFRDDRFLASRAQLKQVISMAPDFAGGYLWLGKTYSGRWGARLDDANIAEPLVRQAMHLNPDMADAYVELGNIALIKYLDAAQALAHGDKALALNPDNVDAWLLKVDASLATGDAQTALAYLDKVNKIDPVGLASRASQGWVAFMAGDFAAAAKYCRIALQSEAGSAGASLECLFEAYMAQGERGLALAQAMEIMKLYKASQLEIDAVAESTESNALMKYYRWRLHGGNNAEYTTEMNPYSGAIYLLKLGLIDEAMERLKEAVRIRQFPQIAFIASDKRLAQLAARSDMKSVFNLYKE